MFTYVHDINAKVEEQRRYLTDSVKVSIVEENDLHVVKVEPVIVDGEETVTIPPVHPKTEAVTKVVPTYKVPEELDVLVRKSVEEIVQDSAHTNHNNWETLTIEVSPILHEEFEDEELAIKFYHEVILQLSEGDQLRHLPSARPMQSAYDKDNSRSH
ncbi:hypothetical protein EalM132_00117 [Exiguobacterium phage vB_EalM-132]|nr:hypothetical protein EalM132_00117 [Exiguobacterium phage vB_EalM-132]